MVVTYDPRNELSSSDSNGSEDEFSENKEEVSGLEYQSCDDKETKTGLLEGQDSGVAEEDCESIKKETEDSQAPDGGWGWFIILGCLLIRFICGKTFYKLSFVSYRGH